MSDRVCLKCSGGPAVPATRGAAGASRLGPGTAGILLLLLLALAPPAAA